MVVGVDLLKDAGIIITMVAGAQSCAPLDRDTAVDGALTARLARLAKLRQPDTCDGDGDQQLSISMSTHRSRKRDVRSIGKCALFNADDLGSNSVSPGARAALPIAINIGGPDTYRFCGVRTQAQEALHVMSPQIRIWGDSRRGTGLRPGWLSLGSLYMPPRRIQGTAEPSSSRAVTFGGPWSSNLVSLGPRRGFASLSLPNPLS